MPEPLSPEPLVAIVIPAINVVGTMGRVLDKILSHGRFEPIVVDDGSRTGPGTRRGYMAPRSWSATRSGVACGPPSAPAGRPGWGATDRTWRSTPARSTPATTITGPTSWPALLGLPATLGLPAPSLSPQGGTRKDWIVAQSTTTSKRTPW